jgi:hypothetical protein
MLMVQLQMATYLAKFDIGRRKYVLGTLRWSTVNERLGMCEPSDKGFNACKYIVLQWICEDEKGILKCNLDQYERLSMYSTG